jgi:hypothetical protein
MKNFFNNIRLTIAFCAAFLVASAYRMKSLFSRAYLATVILTASLVAYVLNKLVVHVIQLKGLDLNPSLPEPTIDDVWGSSSYYALRKQFMLPYMPSWVSASLKDPSKHPGYIVRRPQPEEPVPATVPVSSEASTGIEGHCEPLQPANNELSETISGTVSPSTLDIH